MPRTDSRPKPALEAKLQEFYAELEKRATKRKHNGKFHLIYEGHYSRLFKSVVGNPTYYTPIRKILVETESITVIQRGHSSQPSIIVLNHAPPEPDEWPGDLTGDQVSATLRASFDQRIQSLEAWRENLTGGGKANIWEALRDFEVRLGNLESKLAKASESRKEVNGKST